jgi:hypothetical protein
VAKAASVARVAPVARGSRLLTKAASAKVVPDNEGPAVLVSVVPAALAT